MVTIAYRGAKMEFIDFIEGLIVGKAEEEGKDVNEVMDEVIWNLQVREQEGEYNER